MAARCGGLRSWVAVTVTQAGLDFASSRPARALGFDYAQPPGEGGPSSEVEGRVRNYSETGGGTGVAPIGSGFFGITWLNASNRR